MDEYWDEMNENREMTGRQLKRGEEIPEGSYHTVVHLCLFNGEGKLLCQRRQPWKTFADMWDVTVGGSALAGETSQQAMTRELAEELGARFDFRDQHPLFTLRGINFFDDFYFLFANVSPEQLHLQPSEVKDAQFFSYEEIRDMIANGSFIPWKTITYIFALRNAIMNIPDYEVDYQIFLTDNGIDNDLFYKFHPDEFEDPAV